MRLIKCELIEQNLAQNGMMSNAAILHNWVIGLPFHVYLYTVSEMINREYYNYMLCKYSF